MNRKYVSENLREAIEQLEKSVAEIESDADYTEVELRLDLEHAYHHINFAWNIRAASEAEAAACSEVNFGKWSKFPVADFYEYE